MRWAECKNCIQNTGVQKQNNLTKLPQFSVRVCVFLWFSLKVFFFLSKFISFYTQIYSLKDRLFIW